MNILFALLLGLNFGQVETQYVGKSCQSSFDCGQGLMCWGGSMGTVGVCVPKN